MALARWHNWLRARSPDGGNRFIARLSAAARSPLALRARGLGERALDLFPLTPLGLGLALCAYFALRKFAYEELDLVWLVTGYAALGLCALAPLFVIICASVLYVRTRPPRSPDKHVDALLFETGTAAETGYSLPSLRFVPFVQVRWHWVIPREAQVEVRRAGARAQEIVTLADRGHHDYVERRLMVEDPFGLTRIAFRRRELRGARVLPRLGGLAHLSSLTALAAGSDLPHPMGLEDGDRLELQRYTPGDPARFIHWKVFARTRKLLVRRPERAVAVARRCAAFFVAGRDDDASAAAARLALERRLLGNEWVFGTDRTVAGTTRIDEAIEHLIESVHARGSQGQGLSAFLAQVENKGPASVLVFGPPRPGGWLSAVIRAASRRQLRTVIAVDGVADTSTRPLWARLIARAAPSTGTDAEALDEVLGTLARARIPVILLDRTTGRPLGERARRALTQAREPGVAA
ncbi:MAG TPA: DUF58 domain-containing protein [Polyangiales bacterium]|nr:DUF58 domain-containing protein [Polyangiales bacterium]